MSRRGAIGIIGGSGWLGSAIARGLLAGGVANPECLTCSYRTSPLLDLQGVQWTTDNQQLVERSDAVIVSVRPADWPSITIDCRGKLLISVMAGVSVATLARDANAARIVRAMPNAAAEVRSSYTAWFANTGATQHDRQLTDRIMTSIGTADEVDEESHLDYLTGLTGSGPALPALLARAFVDDAVRNGLAPDLAERAAAGVLIGAGRLLEAVGEQPAITVAKFLAYDGTTAAAIKAMEAAGFSLAVRAGLRSALERAIGPAESSS